MKISVQTGYTIGVLGIDAAFDAYRSAGFDCVDLGIDENVTISWREKLNGDEDPFFGDRNNYMAYVAAIKAASERTGVKIGQAHAPFPLGSYGNEPMNARGIEWGNISIEICGLLGCDKLVIHPLQSINMRQDPSSRATEWEMNIPLYTALIPQLKKYKVTCCLENLWKFDYAAKKIYSGVCSDIDEACRYIDYLNGVAGEKLFGFCLDTGHLTLAALDTKQAIERLGDRLAALHINDNHGIEDNHVNPYSGVTLWDRFIRGIAESNFNGNLNFETFGQYKAVPDDFIATALGWTADIGRYFDKKIAEIRAAK